MIRPMAYEGTEPYIFVSYAHKDSSRVLSIISDLQERGFRVWYDAGIKAGSEWPEYIAEHLEGCTAFLAFLSQASLDSHNCRREINFAIEERKEPLLVYLDEIRLTAGMRMQLGTLHALFRHNFTTQDLFLDELCRSPLLSACYNKHCNLSSPAAVRLESCEDCYQRGEEHYDRDECTDAVKWWRKAAEQGHAESQYSLGYCYMHGLGVRKDYETSAMWYQKAAAQGHVKAQRFLAIFYDFGWGVSINIQESTKWWRKAAEQGDAEAQYNLANAYYYGRGIPIDYNEAARWYRKAAEQNDADAMFSLGICYECGDGVPHSKAAAAECYRAAAALGHESAQRYLDYLTQ